MGKIMKKHVFNLLVVTAALVALIVLIFFTHGINQVIELFAKMKYRWIAASFGCMIVFWLGDALVLHLILRRVVSGQKLSDSVKTTMVGVFFNAVTPFASGGQPAQVYVMAKDGVKPGHAVSVVLLKSVTYQSVIVLYSLAVIILKGGFFMSRIPGFFYLYLLGFLLNFFVVSLYILVIYRKNLAHRITMFLFNLTQKISFLKSMEKHERKLEYELESFGRSAKLLKNNVGMLINTCIIQAIRLSFFFLIPYLIYLSIESLSTANMWNMLAAQSIVTMIASYVPSPGATGGAEGTGYVFFNLFFRSGIVIPVILVWRMITYYSNLIFGGIASILAPEKPLKELK